MNDTEQIKNLLARYAELLNTGQFDEVGTLFPEGHIRIEGNPQTYSGSKEIAQMYRDTVQVPASGIDSLLFNTNLQLEIDGDTAVARSYFVALMQRPGQVVPVVAGRYRDKLQRRTEGWRFSERVMNIDLVGDLDDHLLAPIDTFLPSEKAHS